MVQKLKRELGLWGAVGLGLGSILGTGVFVSLALAAGVAGPAPVPAAICRGSVSGGVQCPEQRAIGCVSPGQRRDV